MIHAVEAVRAQLRVPFYIYGPDVGLPNVESLLAKLSKCMTGMGGGHRKSNTNMRYYARGEYWFMKSIVKHPWRVNNTDDASILVVPDFPDLQGGCPGLTPHTTLVKAVLKTRTWQLRSRDHLFVALHWYSNPWARIPDLPQPPDRALLRASMEARFYDPTLSKAKGFVSGRPASQRQKNDLLFVAPYVDNLNTGASFEAYDGHARGDDPSAMFSSDKHQGHVERDIDFFLGGQFTTRVGPGRFHMGYYPRWQLLHAWSADPASMGRVFFIETDFEGKDINMSHFLDKNGLFTAARSSVLPMHWPAVRRCEHDPFLNLSRLLPRMHASWSANHGAERFACVPRCESLDLRTVTRGACHGRYDPGLLMPRSRFALCPRGDTPTSTRPYDAVAAGAIPVIISDQAWHMGMPFQCLVPHQLMMLTIKEADIERDSATSLRNVTARISPSIEKRMRALLRHFRRDLIWRARDSRVAENVLLEAARMAATFEEPHRQSGLRTPTQTCCPIFDLSDP